MDRPVGLLERGDSLLIVVDLQPGFLGRSGPGPAATAMVRAAWLTGVAAALGIPLLVTEEDPRQNGHTDPDLLARLPAGTPILEKHVFGLTGQPDILAAVEASYCRTAILIGAETDVCVAQSAVGLVTRGFRVAVVTDATYAPGEMHELGLRRMRGAGVLEVHARGVYYEWVRTLDDARRFEAAHPDLAQPPGFSL
jgi:nicotinamidase-related amidase